MVDSSETTAVGVVGLGSLGIRLAQQFSELEGSTLTALADVDADGLAAAGEELSVPSSSRYTDFEAMLDEEPLDAEANYRVRVEQRNGQRAWSSPVWVRPRWKSSAAGAGRTKQPGADPDTGRSTAPWG